MFSTNARMMVHALRMLRLDDKMIILQATTVNEVDVVARSHSLTDRPKAQPKPSKNRDMDGRTPPQQRRVGWAK